MGTRHRTGESRLVADYPLPRPPIGHADSPWSNECMKVTGLDHIVLLTADVERSLAFYCDVLGLTPERVDDWRAGNVGFPSVRINDHVIIDLLEGERSGTNQDHYCVTVEDVDMDDLAATWPHGAVDGPRQVSGARGIGTSVYVQDPDGNTVELRSYGR